jgi:hypothetical protein
MEDGAWLIWRTWTEMDEELPMTAFPLLAGSGKDFESGF